MLRVLLRFPIPLVVLAGCVAPADVHPGEEKEEEGGGESGETGVSDPQYTVTSGGVVVCADPTLRATQPLVRGALGPDWDEQPAAVEGEIELHGGVTVVDLTGDGHPDIYVPDIDGERLYVSDDAGLLHEESATRLPASVLGTVIHGAPADIDGDDDLDLFVTRFDGLPSLLLNDGAGFFTDITAASGLALPGLQSTGAAWADFDGDLDLDLVVAAHRDCAEDPDAPKNGILWQNQGDDTFLDVTDRLPGGAMMPMQGRTPAWVDVEGDGDPDLYFVADVGTPACNAGNLLLLNDGGTFRDPGIASGANLRAEGMGLGVGDLNGDDLPDFVVSDAARLDVLESLGDDTWYLGTAVRELMFDPATAGRFDAWGIELVDLDDDGDLDLPAVYGDIPGVDAPTNEPDQEDAVFLQGDDGTFADVAPAWGWDDPRSMRGLAVVDVDGNGWPDLVRRQIWGPADLWFGTCGAEDWLEVELRGPAPNTRAIGAVVDVVAGDRHWRRWVHAGGTSLYSSTDATVHVGLGDAAGNVTVHVWWPDGVTSDHADLAVDQRVSIRRGW